MATWGDMEKLTWEQLEGFTWGGLERLTAEQIQRYIDDVWPVLAALSPADRQTFRSKLLSNAFPPALVADGETPYSPVDNAALSLWTRQPLTRSEVAAWLAIILAAVQIMQTHFKEDAVPVQPPPAVEFYVELPEGVRPLPQTPTSPESPIELLPNHPKDKGPGSVPPAERA